MVAGGDCWADQPSLRGFAGFRGSPRGALRERVVRHGMVIIVICRQQLALYIATLSFGGFAWFRVGDFPLETRERVVAESARAHSYYSISTGMQIGHPPAVPFLAVPTLAVPVH